MQYKHTFIFTLILGLVWAGLLFGYQNGPDPQSNGIFGQPACNQAGCHVGNPLNASGGSLTVAGLPAEWTPDQTYSITVTVQRTGISCQPTCKFGFQMSGVGANNAQAGTFARVSNKVDVITSAGLQFAQHNALATSIAPFTGVFTLTWRAPSTTAAGTVRFNIAGNAANGNVQNTGDFIYTRVIDVPPVAAPPPPPPDLTFRSYSTQNLGGASVITDGGTAAIDVGYSRIQPDAGSTTPSGVEIFGYRPSTVLVTETGVPASPLITSGRIYAEVGGAVNTGLAIANPNAASALITFNFTNAAGSDFGGGNLTLGPGAQTAKFLNEAPFNGGATVQGTFSFTSTVPVSVVALRGFTNQRSEFLLTTLPIVDLAAATSTATTFLPHFADGGGWTTQVVLVNPTSSALAGTVQFFTPGSATVAGAALNINVNGAPGTSFPYAIPARSSVKLVTSGTPAGTSVGSVRVIPGAGAVAPSSLGVFAFKPVGITLSEAGVAGVTGNAFRLYVEGTGTTSAPGVIQTGLAIANLGSTAATLNFELTRLDGTPAAPSASRTLPANGQIATFANELFPSLTFPFQGVLRISGGTAAGMSVVGLRTRYNERSDFLITTTPASNEGAPASSAELLFPHLVNGGGYTTQFILFSGTAGQAAAGNLRFYKQDGTGLNLTLN